MYTIENCTAKIFWFFRFKVYMFIEQHAVDVYMEFNRNKIQF